MIALYHDLTGRRTRSCCSKTPSASMTGRRGRSSTGPARPSSSATTYWRRTSSASRSPTRTGLQRAAAEGEPDWDRPGVNRRASSPLRTGRPTPLLLILNVHSAKLAFSYGWSVFVSHRSDKTTDDFIADLNMGLGTGHLKSGAPCRGERVAKYNRLMDIEAEIESAGGRAIYVGYHFSHPHKSANADGS